VLQVKSLESAGTGQNGGVLQAIIVVSTVVGLVGRPRLRVREGWGHPGVWLLGVLAVVYLNQVLFTIYMLRVHNGDSTFIAKYLPSGYFALADHDPVIRWLADHFPAPNLLSPTLFRVQSFFELPFAVFAYLTVCRWFGPDLYRRAAALSWAVAVFYTLTFCLIEVRVANPYTRDDILIRIVSMVAVAFVAPRLNGPKGDSVTSAKDLALFLVSFGATGALVLAVYDTALLYNLGHVEKVLPFALVAVVVLAGTRLAARQRGTSAGPGIETVTRTVSWFLAYFAVPALAIRYGLIFGAPRVAAAAGLVVTVAALYQGSREIRKSVAWAVQMVGATAAGLAAAYLGYQLNADYTELRLLAAMTAFCAIAVTTCALVDRAYWRYPSTS
jgi:hypothetical protein